MWRLGVDYLNVLRLHCIILETQRVLHQVNCTCIKIYSVSRKVLLLLIYTGPQPLQLVFDTSIEDKPETPGELPDPEKGGLGGTRPLGMSSTSSNSPILPRPPEHPPPPPPTAVKKPSAPAPAPPPKLDQEVSSFYILIRCTHFHIHIF